MSVRTCAVGGSVRSTGAARRRRRVKVKRRGSIVVASSNGLAEPIDEETHLQDRARRARVARRHRHERLQRRLLLFGTHPDRGGAPTRARRTTVHLRSGARDFLRAPTRPRDHRTKFVVVDFRVSRATARRRAKVSLQTASGAVTGSPTAHSRPRWASSACSRGLSCILHVRDASSIARAACLARPTWGTTVRPADTLFSFAVPTPRQESLTPSLPSTSQNGPSSVRVRVVR